MTKAPVLVALFLLAAPSFAQQMELPKPAAVMAKFEPILGKWYGEGVYRESATAEAMPWKGTMEYQRVIDGHAVQEDLVVDVGAPTPLEMRNVFGHDTGTGRTIALGMSNQGSATSMSYEFVGDNVLLVHEITHGAEGTSVQRTRIEFSKDAYSFRIEGFNGAEKFFTEVEGKFQRGGDASAKAAKAANAAFVGTEACAEAVALSKLTGSYDVKGWMVPAPGVPKANLSGVETWSSLWGGQAAMATVVGESAGSPVKYLAVNYMVWNPNESCYDSFEVNNMGEANLSKGRWTKPGKELVFCNSGVMGNELVVHMTTAAIGEKGPESVRAHMIVGSSAPYLGFEATYSPKR